MLKLVRNAVIAATLSVAFTAPGYAQVDTSATVAACTSEAACVAAVDAFAGGLAGLPAAEADAALGELATALASASQEAGVDPAAIVAGLEAVAAAVSDPAQAAAILSLAASVEAGTDLPVFAVPGAAAGDDGDAPSGSGGGSDGPIDASPN